MFEPTGPQEVGGAGGRAQDEFAAGKTPFSSRLSDLSKKTTTPSFLTKILRIAKDYFSSISILTLFRSSSTLWGVNVSAEHMAKKSYGGMSQLSALTNTVQHIEQMGPPDLVKALQYATKIERMKYAPTLLPLAAIKVRKDVQALKPGDFLATPVSIFQHGLLMEVKCIKIDEKGKKVFSVMLYNTGGGLEYHHKKIVNGKTKFQTAYEIVDVSEESLCGEHSSFFLKLLSTPSQFRSSEYLYTGVLASLDGHLAPPKTEDESFWSAGQFGGSCTTSCVLCFLRAHMQKDQFKQFKDTVRMDMFLKMYEKIQKGTPSSHTVAIALEIAKKLQKRIHSYELQKARTHIEAQIALPSKELSSRTIGPSEPVVEKQSSDRAVEVLSQGFNILKEGGAFTTERHRRVEELVLQANTMMEGLLTTDGKKQLVGLAKAMRKFKGTDQPLTMDETYLYLALLSQVWRIAKKKEVTLPKEFNEELLGIYYKYVNLSTKEFMVSKNKDIDKILLGSKAPSSGGAQEIEFHARQLARMSFSKMRSELKKEQEQEQDTKYLRLLQNSAEK